MLCELWQRILAKQIPDCLTNCFNEQRMLQELCQLFF